MSYTVGRGTEPARPPLEPGEKLSLGVAARLSRYLQVLTQARKIGKETISSQNAQIDMVSGATVTSNGYLESLQSALDKAGL